MEHQGAYPNFYLEVMTYTTGNPDHLHVTPPNQVQTEAVMRKNARWNEREHKVFVSAANIVVAEGQRSGKCFTRKGWEMIMYFFNAQTGHAWSINQLKNHWQVMRNEHKLFKELMRCTELNMVITESTLPTLGRK